MSGGVAWTTYKLAELTKPALRDHPAKAPALVHIDADGVVCDLHVRFTDSRDRRVTYELIAANNSDASVTCRIYEIDELGRTREFGMMNVRGQSAGSSFFAIPLRLEDGRRIYVEVIGEGINLFAEAFQPSFPARLPLKRMAVGFAATVAVVSAITFFVERPSIESLSVPQSQATPGSVFASYAFGGKARGHYLARMANGAEIAEGTLSAPSGSFEIPIPSRAVGNSIRVSLDARGPFGHAMRTLSFRVVAPPPASASFARIESLSAHRETSEAGSAVVVSYAAAGDRGSLRLVDPAGAVLASIPFVRSGTSRFPLTGAAASRAVNAQLVVQTGASSASSAVALDAVTVPTPIVAALAPSVAKTPANELTAAPERALVRDAISIPARIVAGRTLTLSVARPTPGLRIAFEDAMKAVVDEVTVPENGGRVTFEVPASPTKETYYLASSIDRGTSITTSVRALSVYPR